jgi:hypothetical protein
VTRSRAVGFQSGNLINQPANIYSLMLEFYDQGTIYRQEVTLVLLDAKSVPYTKAGCSCTKQRPCGMEK